MPTGDYSAYLEDAHEVRYGSVSFKIEAYRLPLFEVSLDVPEKASLDRDFDIALTATYYAGGRVAARPVQWREGTWQAPFLRSICRRSPNRRNIILSLPNFITLARILIVPVVVWAITSDQMLVRHQRYRARSTSTAPVRSWGIREKKLLRESNFMAK